VSEPVTDGATNTTPDSVPTAYFATRYTSDDNRGAVWAHVTRYLERWIPAGADVLELGAGYCDFSNNVRARTKVAMDIDPGVVHRVGTGVRPEVGDCSDLSRFADTSFDVVFASNLLEHLTRAQTIDLLTAVRRMLRPDGRLILVQPNFRLKPREYFDDYTHVQIFTDRSLPDLLTAEGFHVDHVEARFLPFSMKSRGASLTFLVPWYLRSPFRPLAGQMLVVATA
jgi:SAM-dependent methyltransferase